MGFFSLLARIGLQTSSFEQGIAKCEVMSKKFGNSVTHEMRNLAAGYISTAYAIQLVSEAMDRAAKVDKISKRFDADTDSIQELQYAAEKTDASLDDMGKMLLAVNKARGIALANPEGNQAEYFKKRGVTGDDLKNKSSVDILYKLSDAIRQSGNAEDELNQMFAVMGRAVPPVFNSVREGLRGMAKEAHMFGQVMDKETISEVEKFQKSFARTKVSVGNWMLQSVAKVWNNASDTPHAISSGIADAMLGTDPKDNSYQLELRLRKKLEESQARKAEREKNKTHSPIGEKKIKKTITPEEWSYRPSADGLASVGGFGRSASAALVSNIEKVKDATEKTADNTTDLLTQIKEEIGNQSSP